MDSLMLKLNNIVNGYNVTKQEIENFNNEYALFLQQKYPLIYQQIMGEPIQDPVKQINQPVKSNVPLKEVDMESSPVDEGVRFGEGRNYVATKKRVTLKGESRQRVVYKCGKKEYIKKNGSYKSFTKRDLC